MISFDISIIVLLLVFICFCIPFIIKWLKRPRYEEMKYLKQYISYCHDYRFSYYTNKYVKHKSPVFWVDPPLVNDFVERVNNVRAHIGKLAPYLWERLVDKAPQLMFSEHWDIDKILEANKKYQIRFI